MSSKQRSGCFALLLRWVIAAAAIWLTAWLLQPHVEVDSFLWALVVAVVLGLLNVIVRPIMVLLTLPITVLTLGLFLLVINALLLMLTSALMEGFEIDGFGWALLAAVVIALINAIFDSFLGGFYEKER